METLWFMIVAVMVAAYVVLDGFDLGAGVIYLGAAKTGDERRRIMRAIGPVWDGNEVWLLAAGGTLYFAFPLLYASSFSGFYLPLMMVLWLLMLRGISIELRAHMENPVWRGFFDVVFCISSVLLAVFFGAALGNVVRGVPLGPDEYFFEPLWTNFKVGVDTGILDWYTVLTGVIALLTLTAHGALYVAVKTEGDLHQRCRKVALAAWPIQLILTMAGLAATIHVRPSVLDNYKQHAVGFLIPVIVFASLAVMFLAARKGQDKNGVCRLGDLHRGHAGGSRVRALSSRVAGYYRSSVQPHHLQHCCWTSWARRGPDVVGCGTDSGVRILHVVIPHVSRKGAAGGGGVLNVLRTRRRRGETVGVDDGFETMTN
jgi:cytochrome bd ubiquinol oxidase subunit II